VVGLGTPHGVNLARGGKHWNTCVNHAE